MAVAVDDKGLCRVVMFFFHQRHFHLVLNVLHVHAVAEVQMTHDALECFGVELIARSRTGLHDGIFDLIDAEWFFGTVALRDDEIFGAHCFLVCLKPVYGADMARERKGDISMLGSGKRPCGRAALICAANIGGKNNSAKKKSSEKNRKFSSP